MRASRLAEQMRYLRKSNNYTQKYVGEYLHITRCAYSNYERGIRTPSYEIISSLANLYQISPNYFYPDFDHQPLVLSREDEYLLKLLHSMPFRVREEVMEFILFKKELCES